MVKLYLDLSFEKNSCLKVEYNNCFNKIKMLWVISSPLTEFSSIVKPLAELIKMQLKELVNLMVKVTITGVELWPSTGINAVTLGYHWLNESGEVIEFDGLRSVLPRDILPGEVKKVSMLIKSPDHTRKAKLQISLVQDVD